MMILVTVPEFQDKYRVAKKSKKSGRPRFWTVNGQGLYNATLHFRLRGTITKYFHNYLSKYIREQVCQCDIETIRDTIFVGSTTKLGIAVDIHEIKRDKMPDLSNLWLWIKWFEDALQHCGVIPDDNPDYVIETGKKRYYWVDTAEERKLVFKIYFVKL